jgi:hypothetical protein
MAIEITFMLIILGLVCLQLGYKLCDAQWTERAQEHLEEMVAEHVNEIIELYETSYRNAFANALKIIEEEREKLQK